MALRQRWQAAIDSSVAEFLGGNFDEWKSDLGFCLNSVMEGSHAFLLVENIEIATDSLIQFLLLMVETMDPALAAKKMPPMINQNYLNERSRHLDGMESKRKNEIELLLKRMNKLVSSQKPKNSE